MKFGDIFGVGEVSGLVSKVIDRVAPDQNKAAEMKLELAKLEQTGELAEMTATLDDLKSARDRESAIAISEYAPLINKIITPILAICIIGLTFLLFGYLLWVNAPIPPERKDIIIYILGVLSAICGQIVSYYFGSTENSKKRSDSLVKMLQEK